MRQAGVIAAAGSRRARDDGRAPRRRSRARASLADALASAGRAASIRRTCGPTSCAPTCSALPGRLRRPARSGRRALGHARSAHVPARDAQRRRRRRHRRHDPRVRRARRRVDVLDDETPERVLAIYAHPDDPEISAGGTLARLGRRGRRGARRGHDARRQGHERSRRRSRRAGPRSGSRRPRPRRGCSASPQHHHLDHPDGELADDRVLRLELVRLIRSVRPDVVCCPDPDRGVLRRRVRQPPRPPRHRLGHARRGRARGREPALLPGAGARRASRRTRCARCISRARSRPTSGSTSAPRSNARSRRLFCHASQLVETGDWFREFLRESAIDAGPRRGRPVRGGVPPDRAWPDRPDRSPERSDARARRVAAPFRLRRAARASRSSPRRSRRGPCRPARRRAP